MLIPTDWLEADNPKYIAQLCNDRFPQLSSVWHSSMLFLQSLIGTPRSFCHWFLDGRPAQNNCSHKTFLLYWFQRYSTAYILLGGPDIATRLLNLITSSKEYSTVPSQRKFSMVILLCKMKGSHHHLEVHRPANHNSAISTCAEKYSNHNCMTIFAIIAFFKIAKIISSDGDHAFRASLTSLMHGLRLMIKVYRLPHFISTWLKRLLTHLCDLIFNIRFFEIIGHLLS